MKLKTNRFFINFLTTYILLILVPLFAGIFINRAIVEEYEQHIRRAHLTHLKNTREVLEGFLEDIKWSTYQVAGNTKLLRLISDREKVLSPKERSSLMRETMVELNRSLLYNTSFNSIFYVYLKNQDVIITPYSIYTHSDFNTSVNFFKMDNIDSSAWHETISSQYYQGRIMPVRSVIIEDFKNKRMIPYVQTLPIDENAEPENIEGAIVYLIGEADFIKFLDYEDLPLGGVSYIADQNQNLISLISKTGDNFIPLKLTGNEGMEERVVDGRKMFVIYTTSRKNNWKYVSLLPSEWVMKSVTYYQLLSYVIMLLALLFCLAAAYSLSQHWSHPLVQTYDSLSGYLKSKDSASIRSLSSNVQELINQSEDMKVFVHNVFVNRMISGLFRKEGQIENYLNHLGFSVTEKYFSIAVITSGDNGSGETAESFDEMIRIGNFLRTLLKTDFPLRHLKSEQDNGDFILVVMTEVSDLTEHNSLVTEAFKNLTGALPSVYARNIRVALGEPVETLMRVHSSYIQAQDVLNIDAENSEDRIRRFGDLKMKPGEYYYPLEMESRIITAVKAGNMKTLENLIDNLEMENFENKTLDSNQKELLFSALGSTCFRVFSQLPEKIRTVLDREPGRSLTDFRPFREFMIYICRLQFQGKKSHNHTLIDNIKSYLGSNFMDKNLSLQMVAENFSISESYLSSFFKEQTGTNFSTFLEEIRIRHARELLINTDDSIHDIAGKSGYNSDKSFRRVFQKHHNLSPGKFRTQALKY